MNAADAIEVALGAVIVLATLYDIFQSVVVPRPAVGRWRVSFTLISNAWQMWRRVAGRPRKLQLREAALAAFAPTMVVALLVLWGFFLILGYALLYNGLHDGLRPQPGSFATSLFFSSGRLLAFSVDGIEATGTATGVLTALEAATGFGLFALVISLLFSLFTAFQRRETAVVALDSLAGAPPSGVQLLENCAKLHIPEQLIATFDEWRRWTVEVLESHLSYPLLFYFRSSHDGEAWPNSFGAVMDAATLVLTTIDDGPTGQARLLHKVGSHFVADVRLFFFRRYAPRRTDPGVEHHEFLEACRRLERAGYALKNLDQAWDEFSTMRGSYAGWLNVTARGLAAPPAAWMGDRSYLPHRDRAPARRPDQRAPGSAAVR